MRLRLLATSDLHAHLLGWDYDTDQVAHGHGLARVAGLIKRARAEEPNTLLFDNGDFLNGSALGDYSAANPTSCHPMIAAMNLIGYDAVTLGNHEFSEGMQHLERALAAAEFPIVATNLRPRTGQGFVPATLMLERVFLDQSGQAQNLTVGLVGFLPPQTRLWEADHLQDRFAIEDILTAAPIAVQKLRVAGADIVVALAHSGFHTDDHNSDGENVAKALAQRPDIDAVVAGHIHESYPPKPLTVSAPQSAAVAMPGFFGSHLAVIDLNLVGHENGWRVVSHSSEARPVAVRDPKRGVKPLIQQVAAVAALAAPAHAALRAQGQAQIGIAPHRLHSYFALLQRSSALEMVAAAQHDYLAKALAEGPLAGLPILSAVAPFKVGGRGGPENYSDIPAGPLARRHCHDLYLHPNDLVAFHLSGAQILEWLERSVSLFHRIVPGAVDQPLINPVFPGFNFDVVHGLDYLIDLTQPARYDASGKCVAPLGQRISALRLNGAPLSASAPLILAANSFRMAGGGGFPGIGNVAYRSDIPVQMIVHRHIRAGGAINRLPGSWGFDQIENTATIFETSPVAESLLDEIQRFRPERLGRQENGFHAFRLWL